jgi:phosphoserine phosphatase RsbX
MEAVTPSLVEWGVASAALPGQTGSGDGHLVRSFPGGVMVAAIDGLGHGEEAAAASRIAVECMEQSAHESVIVLVKHCHTSLLRTRGVVMSVASFNARDETMSWVGVGNVEGLLLCTDPTGRPRREVLLLRGGVVGSQLPPLHASLLPVARGDTLIFATDGVRSSFLTEPVLTEPPQQVANRILARHGKGTDDALVLVARYLGPGR